MQPQLIILSSYLMILILIQCLFCSIVYVHVCKDQVQQAEISLYNT